jgi:hypothetical protein
VQQQAATTTCLKLIGAMFMWSGTWIAGVWLTTHFSERTA